MRKSPAHPITKRRWPIFAGAAVLVGLILADRAGWLLADRTDDPATYHGRAVRVSRAIDGDTIEIALVDQVNRTPHTRVRVCGIDCPEVSQRGNDAEPLARDAAAHTRALTEGTYVTLHVEPSRTRDPHQRLLAHVELSDGRNLSRELLMAGLARVDERWPHRYLTWYHQAELIARRARRGIWAPKETSD